MQSTLARVRSTLWTVVLDTGLRTSAYPALRRFIIHSEWKAGMSVRRLAQIIIAGRICMLDIEPNRMDAISIYRYWKALYVGRCIRPLMPGPCILSCITLIGTVSISEDGEGRITGIYLPNSNLPCMEDGETDVLLEAADQLNEYFSGKRRRFDLPLDYGGTEFRTSVLEALMDIPYGEVRTYADIAREISSPRAYRAVGTACAENPLPIVIPCHRVVPSSGGIGHYAGGTAMKKRLLDFERENA